MNRTTPFILLTLLLQPQAARAQETAPPALQFRIIAQTGKPIDGRSFSSDATLGSVALNDAGDAAFIVSDPARDTPTSLYASGRLVAEQGQTMGGKVLVLLPVDSVIAINNAGQVAFEAFYADTKDIATAGEASGLGVFVDGRFRVKAPTGDTATLPTFTLTEDGRILMHAGSTSHASPLPGSPAHSAPQRIRITPPRLPRGVPIRIPDTIAIPGRERPVESRRVTPGESSALPSFIRMNKRGQLLMPVNLSSGGFLLLLGSPKEQ